MQIAQVLAGYTLGNADELRRAMGKKDAQKMKKERARFIQGAVERGIAESKAGEVFDQMETFAAYGFNKSHSAAYALISYRTAYLKAHYPEEFMAGLMTLEMSDADKTFKNIAECRERGIPVLPPDVNVSREDFTVSPEPNEKGMRPIRFGLLAVKGVGSKAVEGILAARQSGGPFRSLADFCRRTQGPQMNKKVVESLLKCGAFDFTGESRRRQVEAVDRMLLWAASEARAAATNQISLFGNGKSASGAVEPPLPDVPPWSDKEMLKAEREVLGFYITAHPLDKYEAGLRKFTSGTIEELRARPEGGKVSVGGVIQGLKLKNSKKGDRYASFTLEDKTGTLEVIVWPEAYRKYEQVLATDDPVCVSGVLETGEERCQIIADDVALLAAARERTVQEVHFALRAEKLNEKLLHGLRETLRKHRGECRAFLHLLLPDRTETVIALPRELRVAASENMVEAVEKILGAGVASFQ